MFSDVDESTLHPMNPPVSDIIIEEEEDCGRNH